jgi:hypothetical protein
MTQETQSEAACKIIAFPKRNADEKLLRLHLQRALEIADDLGLSLSAVKISEAQAVLD